MKKFSPVCLSFDHALVRVLCVQLQCSAAAHHSHVGVWRVSRGHLAGHRAGGNVQYPFLSSPDAVRLVHHAVQPQSRLRQHIALHPGGRLSTVSTDNGQSLFYN